MATHTCLTLIP